MITCVQINASGGINQKDYSNKWIIKCFGKSSSQAKKHIKKLKGEWNKKLLGWVINNKLDDSELNKLNELNDSSDEFKISNKEETVFEYLDKIYPLIKDIYSTDFLNEPNFNILNVNSSDDVDTNLKIQRLAMKDGKVWQTILGNYKEFVNIKSGHASGLDIINPIRKIAIELKNRTNTDNSSSRLTNFNKLAKYKKENPEWTCAYLAINCSTKEEFLKGNSYKTVHAGEEIEYFSGIKALEFILGNYSELVIEYVRILKEQILV